MPSLRRILVLKNLQVYEKFTVEEIVSSVPTIKKTMDELQEENRRLKEKLEVFEQMHQKEEELKHWQQRVAKLEEDCTNLKERFEHRKVKLERWEARPSLNRREQK